MRALPISMEMIAKGGRVLAAWDGKAREYDYDGRDELRAFYRRRAEGVLRVALDRAEEADEAVSVRA